ncbi:hypothetical protein [Niallia taxi]|uniref:hypothetical protein n=1 Tax=Niallia taxi TaxID=2499688 RepID=UPI002E1D45AA|nr:hypothetical protein [Niallia taxi]
MEKKITHPVVDTVHQGVQEIKDVLEKQRYSSEKEPAIAALLDQQFLRMEKLLTEFTEKLEKASLNDIPTLEMNLVGRLKKVFTNLTDGLKQIMLDTKEQVRSGIENKVHDIKLDIHNTVASKVQRINDKIKGFTDTLDRKYSIIEKTGSMEKDSNEVSKKEPDYRYSKESVKQVLFPYIEELNGKRDYIPSTVVEEYEKGGNLILELKEHQHSDNHHALTVDLHTGDGVLEYHFLDSRNENWFGNSKVVDRFHMEDLIIREMEQTTTPIKTKERFETYIKTQDSPALKKAPEVVPDSLKRGNEVPTDALMKQLKKQNDGLKTFVNIVKNKHPEVYQSIYNELKNSLQQGKTDAPKVEGKQKKELQLQL